MGLRAQLIAWVGFVSICATPAALAQDTEPPEYETEVHAPAPRNTPLDDTPGFANEIDATDATEQVTSVADLLERSVSVNTRSLGGLGDFATVSLRGSSSSQVLVLLDGIPLTTASLAQVDVNAVSPDLLERIEVYRSGAPIWLGSAPMGGLVNLVTREDMETSVTASGSFGSFLTRRASVLGGGPLSEELRWDVVGGLSYRGSEGNFTYYDDRGTPYNLDDDGDEERRNNDFNGGDLLFRTTVRPIANLRIGLLESLQLEERGIPGLGQNQAEIARFETLRSITHLSVQARAWPVEMMDTDIRFYLDHFTQHLLDNEAELGLGNRDISSFDLSYGGQARLSLFPWEFAQLDFVLDGRLETFESTEAVDPSTPSTDASRDSIVPSLQLTISALEQRFLATAGGRYEAYLSSYSSTVARGAETIDPVSERSDTQWISQFGLSYRLGMSPFDAALHGTIGWFQRLPTFLEMFGDSGSIMGDPELLSEQAMGGDLGLEFLWASEDIEARLELVGFLYEYEDLIQFIQNSQRVAVPENISSARILGMEMAANALAWDAMWLFASYSLTDAVDTSEVVGQAENQLPGRPTHTVRAGMGGLAYDFELEYDVELDSGNVLDRAGFHIVPDRFYHSAHLTYRPCWAEQLSFTVEVNNIFDHRVEQVPVLPQPPGIEVTTNSAVSDYLGFPLPGRTIFGTLRWSIQ